MHARAVPSREDESPICFDHAVKAVHPGRSSGLGPIRFRPSRVFAVAGSNRTTDVHYSGASAAEFHRLPVTPEGMRATVASGSGNAREILRPERRLVDRICNSCCKLPSGRTLSVAQRRDAMARRATATTTPHRAEGDFTDEIRAI